MSNDPNWSAYSHSAMATMLEDRECQLTDLEKLFDEYKSKHEVACQTINSLQQHRACLKHILSKYMEGVVELTKQRDDLLAENAELKKLSVTNIMIDVVPGGDDSGEEVYAKSVEDVVNLLTSLGEKAEDFDLKNAPLKKQCEGVEMSFLEMEQTISCQQMEIEDLQRTIDEQKETIELFCERIAQLDYKHRAHSKYAKRPILYTDGVNGEQCCRDDLWAVSTEELNAQSELIENLAFVLKTSPYVLRPYPAVCSITKAIANYEQWKGEK